MEDLTGKQLGPYQITAPLGEGGMAAVYKAYQPRMDRYVAMKILPRHFAADPEFVTRFSQEARVIANLQHPHILPVHDFGEADGYTYLVMRFIEGGTLSGWLTERHPISLDKAVGVVAQVGGALDYAHAQGVVHRDIKPGNILVDKWDNCLLTDFGLAKIVESTANLTQTGGILGTPAYMSPEQGLGRKIDSRSDIYSLGVVLYQMAVGYLPYQAETPMAVVIKHIHDPLPPPRQRAPEIPEAIERIILRSLAKSPEDRFDSAGDMVKALMGAADVANIRAVASTPIETPGAPADQMTIAETETLVEEGAPDVPPQAAQGAEQRVVERTARDERSDAASEEAFDSDLTAMLSEASTPAPAAARSESPPSLERTELLSEAELERVEADVVSETPLAPEATAARTGARAAAPMRPVRETASRTPGKSKLPWVLAAVGLVAVIAVIAIVAGGLFSADEEEPAVVTERDGATLPVETEADQPAEEEDVEEVAPDAGEGEAAVEAEPEVSMEELRQELEAAYSNGELLTVLVLLEKAVNLDPNVPNLYCERAYAYGNIEEYGKASSDFEQCLRLAEEQGLPELAREAGGNLALYQAKMHIYEEDNYDLALAILEEASSEPAAPGWLICERAEIFLSLDDLDAAVGEFERCLTWDDIGEGWQIRAQAAIHQIEGERALWADEPLAALEHFTIWAEVEPEAPWPHCLMGDTLNILGAPEEALAAFERCGSVGEDPDAQLWALTSSLDLRVHMARDNENHDEALALYEERISLTPEEGWLYCERADLFLELDALEEALRDIETCGELSGDDPGMLEWVEGLMQDLEERSG